MANFISDRSYTIRGALMGKEDGVLKHLELVDWENISIKLIHYAHWRAIRYKWKIGNPDQLPAGMTPKDIALNAISKVWTGTRAWNPDKYPDLLAHLKWIVKSDMNHLFTSKDHMTSCRINESDDQDNSELTYNEVIPNPSSQLIESALTPEEHLLAKEKNEHEETAKQELFALVKGDDDLELLLSCFEDGIDKPELIAKEMGWDVTKVYTLKRKLLRKSPAINKIMQQEQ
jgi:hypothetical protein